MLAYPYHRYLRWLILNGDSSQEIARHLCDLGYLSPRPEDLTLLIRQLTQGHAVTEEWRRACGVDMFDEDTEDIEAARWIVETGPVRDVCERALVERLALRHVAQVATLKFGRRITPEAVGLFRQGWWDTEALTTLDFAAYYQACGHRKPDPPGGVSLEARPAIAGWAHGILPSEEELSTDDIVRTLQVDAFARYARYSQIESPGHQNEARKWAALVLSTSRIRKPANAKGKAEQPTLPAMRPAVFYPDAEIPSLSDLQQPGDSDDVI